MNWQKVAFLAQFSNNSRRVIQAGLRKVLVIRVNNEFFAVDNACPHMRFPLNLGSVTEDCGIICPFHHSAFDLRTGDVKAWSPWPPGLGRVFAALSREKTLTTYATKVEDGYVWVSDTPSNRR